MQIYGAEGAKQKIVILCVKGNREVNEYEDKTETFKFCIEEIIHDFGQGSFNGMWRRKPDCTE